VQLFLLKSKSVTVYILRFDCDRTQWRILTKNVGGTKII